MAGACLALYLFAPLYLLQFVALFLLFVILGARLYSEYLIRNLRVIRRDQEIRCFRFEWTAVDLTVENRGRLPAFMLALGDRPGDLGVFRDHKRLCTLPGRSRLSFTWRAHCSERGIGSLGPAYLRCADPLGLFPFAAAAGETTRLVVYPGPALARIPSPGGIPLGRLVSPNPLYEDLTRRRSLREYRRGDEPRRINWKASIRLGGIPRSGPGGRPLGGQAPADRMPEAGLGGRPLGAGPGGRPLGGQAPADRMPDAGLGGRPLGAGPGGRPLGGQAPGTGPVPRPPAPPSLLVNEYEAAISYPLVVFLNLDPYEYPLAKRELWFERAIEAAAALCLMASQDRQDLGIILYTPWGEPAGEERPEGPAEGPATGAGDSGSGEAAPGAPPPEERAGPEPCSLIKPGPFTLLPILERLAAIKRPRKPRAPGENAAIKAGGPSGGREGPPEAGIPRASTRALLGQGKQLPYGTRLVYAGPELPGEDYIVLTALGAWHISLEYLVLDERRLGPLAPGGAARYQMREGGYDIL